MHERRSDFFRNRFAFVCALMLAAYAGHVHASVQDEIYGDNFDGFDHAACDSGLASSSAVGSDFAAAMDLCATTTELGTTPGVISAGLSLSSGSGTPAAASHAIRSTFGAGNTPRFGAAMAVLSTGAAAAPGQTNPSFVAFQPGFNTGTSSAMPADWLAANGGMIPSAPGCPPPSGTSAQNPVMLTLRIRVPGNAGSSPCSSCPSES